MKGDPVYKVMDGGPSGTQGILKPGKKPGAMTPRRFPGGGENRIPGWLALQRQKSSPWSKDKPE
jgi:hypothetical protein